MNAVNAEDDMDNLGPASVKMNKNLIAWFLKTQVTGSDPLSGELGQDFETKVRAQLCFASNTKI